MQHDMPRLRTAVFVLLGGIAFAMALYPLFERRRRAAAVSLLCCYVLFVHLLIRGDAGTLSLRFLLLRSYGD